MRAKTINWKKNPMVEIIPSSPPVVSSPAVGNNWAKLQPSRKTDSVAHPALPSPQITPPKSQPTKPVGLAQKTPVDSAKKKHSVPAPINVASKRKRPEPEPEISDDSISPLTPESVIAKRLHLYSEDPSSSQIKLTSDNQTGTVASLHKGVCVCYWCFVDGENEKKKEAEISEQNEPGDNTEASVRSADTSNEKLPGACTDLPPLLYRWFNAHSQGVNLEVRFVSGLFENVFPEIYGPGDIPEEQFNACIKRHITKAKVKSPFISTFATLLGPIHRALRAGADAVVSIIDSSKLDTAAFSAKSIVINSGIQFKRYKGYSEFLIWGYVPKEAIVTTFKVSDLETIASTHCQIGQLLQLSKIRKEDNIRPSLRAILAKSFPSLEAGQIVGKLLECLQIPDAYRTDVALTLAKSWKWRLEEPKAHFLRGVDSVSPNLPDTSIGMDEYSSNSDADFIDDRDEESHMASDKEFLPNESEAEFDTADSSSDSDKEETTRRKRAQSPATPACDTATECTFSVHDDDDDDDVSTHGSVLLNKALEEELLGSGEGDDGSALLDDALEQLFFGTGEVEDGFFNYHKNNEYEHESAEMPMPAGARANLATIAAVAEKTRIRSVLCSSFNDDNDSVRVERSKSSSPESVVDTPCPPERPLTGSLFMERYHMNSGWERIE
ncbi:uncharacterized protein PFLUO_LOCUS4325 [Penicillium psychrofluorescens]|uniref:uncharacterized protein n=1 Tax=Penicillium psychrofluorescens TaxID=3158075 RepID=UPI003CCDAF2C